MTFAHPVPGPISSPYGWRTIRGVPNFHNGIDWHWLKAAPVTSRQVRAPFAGRVTVGRRSDLGLYVTIVSGDFRLRLAHLASASVKTGDTVAVGQHVGVMGNSGFAIGDHLHADLHVKGRRVNPAPYFTQPHQIAFAGNAGVPIVEEKEDDMLVFISVKGDDAVRVVGGGFRYQFKTAGELDAFRNVLEASGHDVPPIVPVSSSWSANLLWNAAVDSGSSVAPVTAGVSQTGPTATQIAAEVIRQQKLPGN